MLPLQIPIVVNLYLKHQVTKKQLQLHVSTCLVSAVRNWVHDCQLTPEELNHLIIIRELTDQVLIYVDIDKTMKVQHLRPPPLPGEMFTLTLLPFSSRRTTVQILLDENI